MKRLALVSALAVLGMPSAAAQAATKLSVDLASGRVDGHRVLGRTIAQVTAALGRPDFHAGPRSRYRIGYGTVRDFSAEVLFRPTGGVERAWSLVFERGRVRDPKAGDL